VLSACCLRVVCFYKKFDIKRLPNFCMTLLRDIRKLIGEYGLRRVHLALEHELLSDYLYFSRIYNKPVQCIYGIFHNSDNKCIYIGCSLDLYNRIDWHYCGYEEFPKRKVYNTIRQLGGWDNCYFKILEQLNDITNIYLREKYFMELYSPIGNTVAPPDRILICRR
jgi:hypothetical protein